MQNIKSTAQIIQLNYEGVQYYDYLYMEMPEHLPGNVKITIKVICTLYDSMTLFSRISCNSDTFYNPSFVSEGAGGLKLTYDTLRHN
jgi:hypothetical protein